MESEADTNTYPNPPTSTPPNADNNGPPSSNGEEPVIKEKVKFDPEAFCYDMTGEKHLVVFNHYKYDNDSIAYYNNPLEIRNNTSKDVQALQETFSNMGFKVHVYHDCRREDIWNILLELREKDFSAASCLSIAILTHGFENGSLSAYDMPYPLSDVLKLFEKHPTLAGKPKLFFVQACRGEKTDEGNRIAIDGDGQRGFFVLPSHTDFLVMRSTVEEYCSWRSREGSWMIQELCKAIREHRQNMDILHIITAVNNKVAADKVSSHEDQDLNNKRQTLETTFTLTKLLKLDDASINAD